MVDGETAARPAARAWVSWALGVATDVALADAVLLVALAALVAPALRAMYAEFEPTTLPMMTRIALGPAWQVGAPSSLAALHGGRHGPLRGAVRPLVRLSERPPLLAQRDPGCPDRCGVESPATPRVRRRDEPTANERREGARPYGAATASTPP